MKVKLVGHKWGAQGDYKTGDIVEVAVTKLILNPKGDGSRELELVVDDFGWEFQVVDSAHLIRDENSITVPIQNAKKVKIELENK